jgi:hypothetical protein
MAGKAELLQGCAGIGSLASKAEIMQGWGLYAAALQAYGAGFGLQYLLFF